MRAPGELETRQCPCRTATRSISMQASHPRAYLEEQEDDSGDDQVVQHLPRRLSANTRDLPNRPGSDRYTPTAAGTLFTTARTESCFRRKGNS
jgi:hypothetical protein